MTNLQSVVGRPPRRVVRYLRNPGAIGGTSLDLAVGSSIADRPVGPEQSGECHPQGAGRKGFIPVPASSILPPCPRVVKILSRTETLDGSAGYVHSEIRVSTDSLFSSASVAIVRRFRRRRFGALSAVHSRDSTVSGGERSASLAASLEPSRRESVAVSRSQRYHSARMIAGLARMGDARRGVYTARRSGTPPVRRVRGIVPRRFIAFGPIPE